MCVAVVSWGRKNAMNPGFEEVMCLYFYVGCILWKRHASWFWRGEMFIFLCGCSILWREKRHASWFWRGEVFIFLCGCCILRQEKRRGSWFWRGEVRHFVAHLGLCDLTHVTPLNYTVYFGVVSSDTCCALTGAVWSDICHVTDL
jgi:hypothetical protein